MKIKSLFLTLITLSLFCACNKDNDREPTSPTDKPSPPSTIEMPIAKGETHYVLLSSTKVVDDIKLEIAVENQQKGKGVWIDLNANGKKDAGEEITGFHPDIKKLLDFAELGFKTLFFAYITCKPQSPNIAVYGEISYLFCENDSINSLDIMQNKALRVLVCDNNQLSSLNISQNKALIDLSAPNNQLSSLDLSQNRDLIALNCDDNQLNSLNLSQNDKLKYLNCQNNLLNSLDLSQNDKLKTLYCSGNDLGSLDLSQHNNLENLNCSNNQLTSLKLFENGPLDYCFINDNKIEGKEMAEIINKLKDRKSLKKGVLYVVGKEKTKEGNKITKTQVGILVGKNWEVRNARDKTYEGDE